VSQLNYIKHENIDFQKWDECISNDANGRIYALSWHLDKVSPNWDGIVMDDYKAIFPICRRTKFKLQYITHPLFSQQMGVFGKDINGLNIKDFIDKIPYKYVKTHIQVNSTGTLGFEHLFKVRNNSILRLDNLERLKKGFNQNTKRNLKKFQASNLVVTAVLDINLFMEFKKSNSFYSLKEDDWELMKEVVSSFVIKGFGEILGVYVNGELISAVFFASWNNRIYYLFSASNEKGKEMRAAFGIVYSVISKHQDSNKFLDFEGSMDVNINRFFLGFGAIKEDYYEFKKGLLT
jgi:hypothetical protein